MLIGDDELAARRRALEASGGYQVSAVQTPWQEIQRCWWAAGERRDPEGSEKFQRIAQTRGMPRDNH